MRSRLETTLRSHRNFRISEHAYTHKEDTAHRDWRQRFVCSPGAWVTAPVRLYAAPFSYHHLFSAPSLHPTHPPFSP